MAPEQVVNAKSADQRSDIYSLGVVMYEMVCNRLPFDDGKVIDDVSQLFSRIMSDAPLTPIEKRPDIYIPISVSRTIMRAMEKDPNERFQSIDELVSALESCADDPIATGFDGEVVEICVDDDRSPRRSGIGMFNLGHDSCFSSESCKHMRIII